MFNVFNLFRNKNDLFLSYSPLEFSKKTLFSNSKNYFFDDIKSECLDVSHRNCLLFTRYDDVCFDYDKPFYDDLDFKTTVFKVVPGFIGREFNKSCSFQISELGDNKSGLFEVLAGTGFFVLENNLSGDLIIIKVKFGDRVFVPSEYSFVLVNSSKYDNFVVMSITKKSANFNGCVLEKFNGANLFYTKTGFVRNLNSKNLYNLDNLQGDYLLDMSFDKGKHLYSQLFDLPAQFNFLK